MNLDVSVTVLVGKRVDSISEIAKSYSSACTLRHFVGFQKKKIFIIMKKNYRFRPLVT